MGESSVASLVAVAAVLTQKASLFLAVVAAVAVLSLVWLVVIRVMRRRHDRALEAEMRRELEPPAPGEIHAEVRVIPPDELPKERATVFMPVPSAIAGVTDFVDQDRDGVSVRSCVRAEDVDALMTDEQALSLNAVVYRTEQSQTDVRAFVSLDALSERFSPYSYINLNILKQQGMMGEAVTALAVEARGVLRKPLMVEADEFSRAAVKMLSLTGGRAITTKATAKSQRSE